MISSTFSVKQKSLVSHRTGHTTALLTMTRHYQYKVMPFGLACISSVFKYFTNDILGDILEKFTIAFIKDIF